MKDALKDSIKSASKMAWIIADMPSGSNEQAYWIKQRNLMLDVINALQAKPHLPDYTPVLPPSIPLVYRDLIAEHNERFLIARNAVLRLKMERWVKHA